jgi:hypothetical protein
MIEQRGKASAERSRRGDIIRALDKALRLPIDAATWDSITRARARIPTLRATAFELSPGPRFGYSRALCFWDSTEIFGSPLSSRRAKDIRMEIP